MGETQSRWQAPQRVALKLREEAVWLCNIFWVELEQAAHLLLERRHVSKVTGQTVMLLDGFRRRQQK